MQYLKFIYSRKSRKSFIRTINTCVKKNLFQKNVHTHDYKKIIELQDKDDKFGINNDNSDIKFVYTIYE